MNKVLLLVMLVLPLISCGSKPPEKQLHGTWKFSAPTLEEMAGKVPEMKEFFGEFVTTFKEDGTFEITAPDLLTKKPETTTGTFSVIKTEGDQVTVEIEMDGVKKTEVFTMDGDRMTQEEDGKTLEMIRQ